MKSLFIFRRDLRLEDNTSLIEALKASKHVIPCFIFDPRQLKSPYSSNRSISFMIQSLKELARALEEKKGRLYFFCGEAEKVISKLLTQENIQALYINKDYTPFSLKRDESIAKLCQENHCEFHSFHDALLTAPGDVLKEDEKPYTVFTPFFRKAQLKGVKKPNQDLPLNFYTKEVSGCKELSYLDELIDSPSIEHPGGRSFGLKLLADIRNLEDYQETRNFPALKQTTNLSPHHKFGTISIRETYFRVKELFGKNHTLISELYWRDFFTHIAFHFPYVFGKSFQKKFDKIPWKNDEKQFQKWKEGQTGFPIVDAAMRELNSTGWMHNRSRMIVASFLVKDLHIDWRWGEQYFAQKLVDYDPAVNNGSWQWAASTGCDAQPYFRIFNPLLQQERFDPDCVYIKKWVPELEMYSPKQIHNLKDLSMYPEPMVNHSQEAQKSKDLFAKQ